MRDSLQFRMFMFFQLPSVILFAVLSLVKATGNNVKIKWVMIANGSNYLLIRKSNTRLITVCINGIGISSCFVRQVYFNSFMFFALGMESSADWLRRMLKSISNG